jgi:hypothetical protein
VSTNHYVLHNRKWIRAVDHPESIEVGAWAGGNAHPLICLNTDTHQFKVGRWIFRDYDETSEGDFEAMRKAERAVNGKPSTSQTVNSDMACSPLTQIRLAGGSSVPASEVRLGDALTHGKVVGIVKKEVDEYCVVDGVQVALGTLVWIGNSWVRAEEAAENIVEDTNVFYNFVVTPSASVETASGLMFRDYVEVHSPDMEASYSEALLKEEN